MQFKDKINQSVAEAVSRIMNEKLHPNQQKIDVVDDEKIDGKDFAKLRKMKKEEVEQVEEGMSHQASTTMKHIPNASPALKKAAKDIKPGVSGYQDRVAMLKAGGVKEEVESIDEGTMTHITLGAKVKDKEGGYTQDVHHKGKKIGHIEAYKHRTGMRYGSHHDASGDATAGNRSAEESIADVRYAHADHLKSMKEEVENLDEVKMADLPSTKVQGRAYGASKPEPHAVDVLRGPKEKELKSIESEKKKPVNEEDAYDKEAKTPSKPHNKEESAERAKMAAVAARKAMTKEEVELQEKLSASADAGDYIKDFQKSDAPQFKGKSPEKRRIMGIAAYLASKRGK